MYKGFLSLFVVVLLNIINVQNSIYAEGNKYPELGLIAEFNLLGSSTEYLTGDKLNEFNFTFYPASLYLSGRAYLNPQICNREN